MCNKCALLHHPAATELFLCDDCGVDTSQRGIKEWYMIDEGTWDMVANADNILCIGCLEKRLGFRLSPWHFQGYPVNFMEAHSARLDARIYG